MILAMCEKLRNFIEAVDTFDAVCQKVPPPAWDSDSPCEGWTARQVLGHQCSVLDALSRIARTGEWARPVKVEPPADPLARWALTREEVLAALGQPGVMEREDKYWFGRMDMATFVSYVQWDPLTHAWDIGKATGVGVNLPPKLCEVSYRLIGARADWFRETGRIGPAVQVSDDASIVDRYLAMVGRQP
ncbi:MAG: TIGR03086 family protein [Actinomycetia bacterium]|nr:TIGR03086 family protein [Actinomycetes bacterium]